MMSNKYAVLASYAQHMVDTGRDVAPFTSQEIVELLAEREADKARIAELETRKVKLPKRSVGEVMHMSGFSRDYAEGWCSGNDNAIHEIRAAGITLETGEQQ